MLNHVYDRIARRNAREAALDDMTPVQRAAWLNDEDREIAAERLAEYDEATAIERECVNPGTDIYTFS